MQEQRRVARNLGLLFFSFAIIVSLVIVNTNDELTIFDYILVVGIPPALGCFAYFVGFHHDPNASD